MLQVCQLTGFGGSLLTVGPAPTVAATNTGNTAAATSYAVPLPASIAAGDLLMIFIACYATSGAAVLSAPSGWNTSLNVAGGSNLRAVGAFWKVASGSEGSTVTVSADISVQWVTNAYRLTGHRAQVVRSTALTGAGSAPSMSAVTPTWSKAATFITTVAALGISSDPTPPTGYASQIGGLRSGTIGIYSARRSAQVVSEDPDAYTLPTTLFYVATTFAIA